MARLLSCLLAGMTLCFFIACATEQRANDPKKTTVRIAAVYVPGGLKGLPYKGKVVKEYPYNDTIHDTLRKVQGDFGIEFQNILTESTGEYESILRGLARSGRYDVIVVNGFQATKALIQVAKEFPGQKFLGVEAGTDQEGTPHHLPNLAAYTANYYQPMYTGGALAAMMTKTGIIGSVWSMDEKKYGSYVRAYTDGARSVNPNIKVLAEYTGSYQEQPPKGKECAERLIKQGADILMNHTQGERTGVIAAVKEKGVALIGFGQESKLAPNNTLFDLNRHQSNNLYEALKNVTRGRFEAGTFYQGLVERHYTVDFTQPSHAWITPAARQKVDDLIRKFKSGELKKPWTADIPDLK